jgi:GT2 family glycosyltransferase
MFVRTAALAKTGLMKANYFLYYEEMDWCDSFKRNGYTIRVNMQALIYHKESLSVGRKSQLKEYFMNRNRILFIRRNAGFLQRLFFYMYFILVVTPRNLLQYRKENMRGFSTQLFRAIGWNLTHSVNSEDTGYKPIQIK